MKLVNVYDEPQGIVILYMLLQERTPDQSISHKEMPSFNEHIIFVESMPYEHWDLIKNDDGVYVGSVYMTKLREIGIFIFEEFKHNGYGSWAVNEAMRVYGLPLYANINPRNESSIKLFEKMGAKHIQQTFILESPEFDAAQ